VNPSPPHFYAGSLGVLLNTNFVNAINSRVVSDFPRKIKYYNDINIEVMLQSRDFGLLKKNGG
jgi:hypothetical protein